MFIQIEHNHWVNVLQIGDIEVIVEKLMGVKAIVTMNYGRIFIITKDIEEFVKELESYRIPVKSAKK